MTGNYNGRSMKQYFGDVVSFPTHLNYCPLSHESSPNDRMQGSGDECVLGARPGVHYIQYCCICLNCVFVKVSFAII